MVSPTHEAVQRKGEERLYPKLIDAMYEGNCQRTGCHDGVMVEEIASKKDGEGALIVTQKRTRCPYCKGTGKALDEIAFAEAVEKVGEVGPDEDLEVYTREAIYTYLETLRHV